jgi:hypothetical protein
MSETIGQIAARPLRCKICGKMFETDPLKTATLIGANPQAKLQQINAILAEPMKHLQKKHAYHLGWAQLMGGEYGGMLALNFFDCDAEIVEKQRDYARWKVHTLTRRAHVTDERIVERLTKTFSDFVTELHAGYARDLNDPTIMERVKVETEVWMASKLALAILAMIRDMRDVLQEKDRYQMTDGPPPTEEPAAAAGSNSGLAV